MGIIDEVERKPSEAEIESRTIKTPQGKELEARDLMYKAGHLMKAPFMKVAGVASIFFYENDRGETRFEFQTFLSMSGVGDGIAKAGLQEFGNAMMTAYGVDPDKNTNRKKRRIHH